MAPEFDRAERKADVRAFEVRDEDSQPLGDAYWGRVGGSGGHWAVVGCWFSMKRGEAQVKSWWVPRLQSVALYRPGAEL